ncbi:MAG: hypothetical protein IJ846_00500 [Alphaproteobacteria bacterium]|nr:hypothetical protein [Alphaproteobacteria bacterium]
MVTTNKNATNEIIRRFYTEQTLEVTPSDLKRIIIPVFGFSGAKLCEYTDWNGENKTDAGITFFNPKDNSVQFLKQKDGCLILYDGLGRREKISKYLKKNPNVLETAEGIRDFIKYIKENVVTDSGKADLWNTDTEFVSNLKDAPKPENIKSGKMVVFEKKQVPANALYVAEGLSFQGPAASPQIADKGGAYVIKEVDKKKRAHYRMVQKEEFKKAYKVTRTIMPKLLSKNNGR